ncbi:head-tail adaptor protein [Actibacterium sp.]|uniref:head-tail adaptor protein n=1 Tax=Actibacterium sp. TaxID=1872125 RepID=UPI00356B27E0
MRGLPKLSRRLVLEAPQRLPDGAGGFVQSWGPLGSMYAEVLPGSGREVAGQSVALSRLSYRITVRGAPVGASFRPKPDQRFREGDRIFRILAVTERDARAAYLTCYAEEEGAA